MKINKRKRSEIRINLNDPQTVKNKALHYIYYDIHYSGNELGLLFVFIDYPLFVNRSSFLRGFFKE